MKSRASKSRRIRLTPKQRVLKRVPTAYAKKDGGFYEGMWVILDSAFDTNCWSNHTKSPAAAWRDALRHI